jgi:FdhD protein
MTRVREIRPDRDPALSSRKEPEDIAKRLPTSSRVAVLRSRDGHSETTTDQVAEETPIALTYHGVPQVVMMATPENLEDLAFGFTVTESIVNSADEILSIQAKIANDSAQVDIAIVGERFSELLRRQRNLTGRTGCGLCGVETIEQAIRSPARVRSDFRVTAVELHATLRELGEQQRLNRLVGSVHGAAWALPNGGIKVAREDVGRHNALDKVVGALLRDKVDPAMGFLLITSRASYEMVLKAATVGVSLLVAVSAPTALAIRLAKECGMTLVGFARTGSDGKGQHVIYANPERVIA